MCLEQLLSRCKRLTVLENVVREMNVWGRRSGGRAEKMMMNNCKIPALYSIGPDLSLYCSTTVELLTMYPSQSQ